MHNVVEEAGAAGTAISVIVPVLNEAENIDILVDEIQLAALGPSPIREIVYVDDGSTDGTLERLLALQAQVPMLRVIRHERPLGQSAAFLSGARAATGDLLVFMDGDLQNDPADISSLFECYRRASAAQPRAAVLGQRAVRKDNPLRRISSRLANKFRAAVLKDGTRDTGCSLKLIRRADFLALPYFDHVHRFLPAMLLRNGVELHHVAVSHRPRVKGRSKYGFWNRALVGAVDLAGAAWLQRRRLPSDYAPKEITNPVKAP
ncbi:glycosyltransferase family 2 protein [Pseudaminobacter sp. 19-2017]|uniref:Glycosyltransferase family 2 protein n=1 Tax=Pseudaminobacter soli (ex Zhang et al. 2022) TaxID=2831468 RepID=A0A942DVE8_9HYPH|nr:glycosyltransferase family 2 protein [Pseudaminobacter soli]MBS3647338.1 glycosyltransferase family 2 protein [Pseudaminobacter soli]